jgi:hypothetical protein
MTIEEMLNRYRPVWAPEDETGGGDDKDTDEGGVALGGTGGEDAADDAETKDKAQDDAPETALNGGTAEGEDNTGEDDGEGKKDGEDEAEAEVPEEYDFSEVELPEGMEIDAAFAEAATPVLKELGLNQEQANKMAALYATQMQAQAEANMAAVKELIGGWVKTAKADTEVGGANWDESVRLGNAALRQFGTPELIQDVMVDQGLGNHPEVIRFMARIGKHVASDNAPTGNETETAPPAPEETWYGATTPTSKKG